MKLFQHLTDEGAMRRCAGITLLWSSFNSFGMQLRNTAWLSPECRVTCPLVQVVHGGQQVAVERQGSSQIKLERHMLNLGELKGDTAV